jgi:RND family efflux transporter MFP subunit
MVAGLAGCDEEQVPEKTVVRPVRAMKVSDTAAFQRRTFSGQAKATKELDLGFNVSGPLVEFPANVGDEVKKGDLLARIDPAPFNAEVKRAQATLNGAAATRKNAQLQRDRDKTLFDKGHVAKARLDQTEAKLSETIADVGAADAVLGRARLDLQYTYLRAPFTGIVVQTYVENFESVQIKQPAIRLVDASRIEMVVDIPESLISIVPRAKDLVVAFDAFPDLEVPAQIKEIGTEASETTRTYPVTLIMEQPTGVRVLPGMAGKAYSKSPIAAAESGAGLEIPVSAVLTGAEAEKTYVWVIDESTLSVQKRAVTPGPLTDRGIKITAGLQPGEWIATAGVHSLKDGQKVRILEQ